jgi:DNA-binding CsgD family transcriptional regulator
MAFRAAKHGLPRGRAFPVTSGSLTILRERLDSLAAAFLADSRPGLIFEYGRLIFANDAAGRLLRSTESSDAFLNALKVSVDAGVIDRRLLLHARSGVFAPVLRPAGSGRVHPTRICFLVKRRDVAPTCEGLSDRELDVVRQLVEGLTNQEIADELGISIETVRKHVSKALEKTGAKTRAGLVAKALSR